MADPFDEAYEKFKNVPTETLKKNIAAPDFVNGTPKSTLLNNVVKPLLIGIHP